MKNGFVGFLLARWVTILALTALFACFLAFGLWVRQQMPVPIGYARDTEIYSFDYLGYAATFTDFHFIGYGRFRHPLWGWLLSPITLWGQRLHGLNEQVFWVFILSFFALVAVGSVWLMHRLLRHSLRLGKWEALSVTTLFLSFGHVWLLGGMPETYGISMFLSLCMLYWGLGSRDRIVRDEIVMCGERVSASGLGCKLDGLGWGMLALLMGGITITQVMKTALSYWIVRRPTWRKVLLGGCIGCALLGIVVSIFALRVYLRVKADPTASGFDSSWHTLVDNFPASSLSLPERLRCLWIFLSEPILLRGEPFDERMIVGGYDFIVQPLLLALVYVMALVSAWMNRGTLLVKLLLMILAVDVSIHFIAQWGILESHLYAGHWFFSVPLVLGLIFPHLKKPLRPRFAFGIALLALALFGLNLHGFFGHDVGLAWPPAE